MTKDTRDSDFEFARTNYYDLLVKGSEALGEMMDLARATEHPRAFEVLSGMMKNVADINGNLIDLHKKKSDMEKGSQAPALSAGQTTHNVFIGSTADLQKMLATNMKDVTPNGSEDS